MGTPKRSKAKKTPTKVIAGVQTPERVVTPAKSIKSSEKKRRNSFAKKKADAAKQDVVAAKEIDDTIKSPTGSSKKERKKRRSIQPNDDTDKVAEQVPVTPKQKQRKSKRLSARSSGDDEGLEDFFTPEGNGKAETQPNNDNDDGPEEFFTPENKMKVSKKKQPSSQQKTSSSKKKAKSVAINKEDGDEAPEEAAPSATKAKEGSSTKKSRKREQREKLKTESVGFIPKDDDAKKGKKITFTDEDLEDLEKETTMEVEETEKKVVAETNDDDDDDDAVEEVATSQARELALKDRLQERVAAQNITKKKKKSKKKKANTEEEDEDLDDSFFAQLEVVRAQEAEDKQLQEKAAKGQNKRTTFVVNNDEELKNPNGTLVDDNMRVVVLNDDQSRSIPSTAASLAAVPIVSELSAEAQLFSRSRLVSGEDAKRESQYASKLKKRVRDDDETWRRSKRMNHLLVPKAKVRARIGKGQPAPNFVVSR